MMVRILALVLALLVPAFAAGTVEEQPYPAHLLRVEARGGKPWSELQMPLASYVDGAGRQVDLVGAVHIAEQGYYEQLNKLFRGYDRVLYEMVDGEGVSEMLTLSKKVEAGTATSEERLRMRRIRRAFMEKKDDGLASQLLAYYYVTTAQELHLALQTEVIDYGFENFVFADLSQAEFARAMAARGETWWQLAWLSVLDGFELSDLFQPLATTVEKKRRQLIRMVSKESEGSPMEGMAVIVDRNARCFEVLDRELLDAGNRTLAIFYGSMHLRDMDARLRARGFRLQKVTWMTAIRAEGASAKGRR